MIDLFQHNKNAYEAAKRLMDETGKAAIVHPTGTGKSLIAFKLAEDYPDKHIVWLAPSEYIFKTQLENLQQALEQEDSIEEVQSGHFANITFLTYSKLMMNQELIEQMNPDYIILDEFHRCGARQWGKGVTKLLEHIATAKVLGLSATNVRYLDNQRDMAEEIFDGCIASEMTLGQAIAQNILPAPRYVISLYSYQEEIEKLSKRIKAQQSADKQRVNEELLEQLKRALEQAEGLDNIFAKHMSNKNGKYIIFCANREHMKEMMEHVQEWFRKVDKEPHVYAAYYNNPETSLEFSAFKKDDSKHLKLLFCIDMLNEGVHVSDIDGVILLRPTVSPILYLQQIGRTLAAGKKHEPVIFDIVNNFDNLYSIDLLKEEIDEALMPCTHGERERFQERFHIIDEVWECRKIFDKLQKNLSATWEIYYLAAKEYHKNHGHIRIPKSYVTEGGLTLGSWLQTQRRVRAGKRDGSLSTEQISKLDALGMVWEVSTHSWEQGYQELQKYVQIHGNADVTVRYQTEDEYPLGKWLQYIREKKNQGTLSQERIVKLEALGVIWDKTEHQWKLYFDAASAFYKANGNLEVSSEFVTDEGLHLGDWLANQRKKALTDNALSEEQKQKLEAIGMRWDNAHQKAWAEKYELAKRFYQEKGHLDIPSDYMADGVRLGAWIGALRQKRMKPDANNMCLTQERIEALDRIGMIWNKDSWEIRYQLAAQYYAGNGHLEIPQTYVTADGIWLGKWVARQRQKYRGKSLPQNRKIRLEKIGMDWKEYSSL